MFPTCLGEYLDNQEKTLVLYERPQPLTPLSAKGVLYPALLAYSIYTVYTVCIEYIVFTLQFTLNCV